MGSKKSSIAMFVLFVVITPCVNADEPASKWVKHDKAVMGPSRPIALVHAPGVQRWMALGYYATTSDRKPAYYKRQTEEIDSLKATAGSDKGAIEFAMDAYKHGVSAKDIMLIINATKDAKQDDSSKDFSGNHQICFDFAYDIQEIIAKGSNNKPIRNIKSITLQIYDVPYASQGNDWTDNLINKPHKAIPATVTFAVGSFEQPEGTFDRLMGYVFDQQHTVICVRFQDNKAWYLDIGMIDNVIHGQTANNLSTSTKFSKTIPKGWTFTGRTSGHRTGTPELK